MMEIESRRLRRRWWRSYLVSGRVTKAEEVEESSSERKTNSSTTTSTVNTSATSLVVVRAMDSPSPPVDDCCPICFGSFVVPCRAPCGHWYCGGCILQYWNYGAALQPCKCPMCFQQITRLTLDASLNDRRELEDVEVLENVQKYNRLFVGGLYGLILKVLELPLFVKRVLRGMMDPDRANDSLYKLRLFALLLGLLYALSPFDFLPTDRVGAIDLFDYSAIAFSFILYLVGLYVRRRRFQRARQLDAIQP